MSSPTPPSGPDGYGSPGQSPPGAPQQPPYGGPQPPQQGPGQQPPYGGEQQPPYAAPGTQADPASGAAFGAAPPPGYGGPDAPPPKKKVWPWIVGGCGCLVIIAVLVIGAIILFGGGLGLFSSDEEPSAPAASETTEPEPPEPESDEPETTEPETDEPETDDPGSDLPEVTEGEGEVTDDDLDPAKELVVNYLEALVTGEYDEACGYMYDESSGQGFDADNPLTDLCVGVAESIGEEQDLSAASGQFGPDDFDAEIEGNSIEVTFTLDDETAMYVVKGSDEELYIAG